MFARRFANQHRLGRREKIDKKKEVEKMTGVLKEIHLNQKHHKDSGATVTDSKIPVASKGHKKQSKQASFNGAVRKSVIEAGKSKHVKKPKKEGLMPTNLIVCEDAVMVTCDEDDTIDEPYTRDIHRYLQRIESKCCPQLEFIQKGISAENRRVLLSWMRDVQEFLDMHQETFHLAITIIDLILQKSNVKLQEYQLLGLVGFFIAAKFTERYLPEVDTLMYLASYAYNSQLILQKEREVIHLMDFDFNLPTTSWFLQYYAQDTKSSSVHHLAEALTDLFILDSTSVSVFPPSIRAASSLVVANKLRGTRTSEWLRALLLKCSHSERDLHKANTTLMDLIQTMDKTKTSSIEERVATLL